MSTCPSNPTSSPCTAASLSRIPLQWLRFARHSLAIASGLARNALARQPSSPKQPCALSRTTTSTMPMRPTQHRPAGYNPNAAKDYAKQLDKRRGSASERGYNSVWRSFRNRFLKEHPLCAYCLKQDVVTMATVVDHIIPHRGDPKLFWMEGNVQSLCPPCHNSVKQREEQKQAKEAKEHAQAALVAPHPKNALESAKE